MHATCYRLQGENLIHGLACRLEERMSKGGGGGPLSDLFGVLHTLADTDSESFKVSIMYSQSSTTTTTQQQQQQVTSSSSCVLQAGGAAG